uniref:Beta-lactamase domain-containing protein n=1 Tax=Haemonchus contortus TaxID=6289 RepID=A0A7I4Y7K5_HAECO
MVHAVPTTDGRILDPQFNGIDDVFRENFSMGLESAGACFAVFHNGRLVVDLWGGAQNRETGQPWKENTMSIMFSTTKSVASTILAMVMDREEIPYAKKVAEFWPDFAKNGKQDITIMDIVHHQAGLPYSDQTITREDVADWRRMSTYFEDATPIWVPGSQAGYHALTFGFLIDQIVRRLDPGHRGLTDFLKEITLDNGITDLSIGLQHPSDNDRVAVLQYPGELQIESEGRRDPESLRRWNAGDNDHHKRLYDTWPWITTDDYNSMENRLLPMPSNMGIGNARSLAHFHSLITEGKLLSGAFNKNFERPVLENEFDHVIGYEENKGYGFQFTKNPKGQWIFGHSGFGGQNVRVDLHNGLSYAYLCSGLKISDADLVEPWKRLVDKLYSLL